MTAAPNFPLACEGFKVLRVDSRMDWPTGERPSSLATIFGVERRAIGVDVGDWVLVNGFERAQVVDVRGVGRVTLVGLRIDPKEYFRCFPMQQRHGSIRKMPSGYCWSRALVSRWPLQGPQARKAPNGPRRRRAP